jgi:hypothetical protein
MTGVCAIGHNTVNRQYILLGFDLNRKVDKSLVIRHDISWFSKRKPLRVILGHHDQLIHFIDILNGTSIDINTIKSTCYVLLILYYRGLARDVIYDVTDGRRHVGGIFFAPRGTF